MTEIMDRIEGRAAGDDPVHAALKKVVERRNKSYLWVPGDTPPFKPALMPLIYGDGRALFSFGTINQRPRYWVIRGDSRWECGIDVGGVDIAEISDELLTDLEDQFGSGRCCYSGSSLFWPKRDRSCDCEECSDRLIAKWPMVDGCGGCHWSRMDWPKEFATVPNPVGHGNLLAIN